MVNTIRIFIWGALDSLLIYKVLRTLVTYEFNRHREKKLRAEAVYVMRTNRYEILLYALVILPFSIGAFLIHLWKDVGFHFAFDFIGLGMIGFLMFFFWNAAGTYTKISPEGIERGEPCNDTVFFRSTRLTRSHTTTTPTVNMQTPSISTQSPASWSQNSAPFSAATPSSQ